MHDFGPYHRLTFRYHTDLLQFWGEAEEKWLTDKAKINELVKIIPRKYRIESFVFKKEDGDGIRKAMEQAINRGYWVGLRSCYLYQPLGKAPWIMALKSRRAIRLFFEKRYFGRLETRSRQRQTWLGTPAHYDEWLADHGLKEIVVMFNPSQLCPKYKKEHLVGRIEIFENNLRVEMMLNTDQLRDVENQTGRESLIVFNMAIKDRLRFEKRPIVASFGRKYFQRGIHLPKKKVIEMLDGLFGEFRPKSRRYKNLVKPQALAIAYQVSQIIFDEWCGAPFNLYYRLQALHEFGLGILEFQGRMENGKIAWLKAYGLRGVREVSKII